MVSSSWPSSIASRRHVPGGHGGASALLPCARPCATSACIIFSSSCGWNLACLLHGRYSCERPLRPSPCCCCCELLSSARRSLSSSSSSLLSSPARRRLAGREESSWDCSRAWARRARKALTCWGTSCSVLRPSRRSVPAAASRSVRTRRCFAALRSRARRRALSSPWNASTSATRALACVAASRAALSGTGPALLLLSLLHTPTRSCARRCRVAAVSVRAPPPPAQYRASTSSGIASTGLGTVVVVVADDSLLLSAPEEVAGA